MAASLSMRLPNLHLCLEKHARHLVVLPNSRLGFRNPSALFGAWQLGTGSGTCLAQSPVTPLRITVPCRAQGKGRQTQGRTEEAQGPTKTPAPIPPLYLAKGIWVLFAAYMLWLFVLPYAPGDPAWSIGPSTVDELAGLSLNFFFILPLLNILGFHGLEAPSLHPVAEGLFNFVVAWTLMFGPLLAADARARPGVSPATAAALWSAQMFLTNVFLIPYMALRLSPKAGPSELQSEGSVFARLSGSLARSGKVVAAVGLLEAALSLCWAVAGRVGEGYGDSLGERWAFFVEYVSSDRLAYAFLVDIILYAFFQAWLARDIMSENTRGAKSRVGAWTQSLQLVPCFGMGVLLAFVL